MKKNYGIHFVPRRFDLQSDSLVSNLDCALVALQAQYTRTIFYKMVKEYGDYKLKWYMTFPKCKSVDYQIFEI